MSKSIRILLLTLILWGGVFVFGLRATSLAHESEEHLDAEVTAEEQHSSPAVSQDYQYNTPAGCSLSLLTRRSLQLYDQGNDSVTLSEPQIIFAETNIVKRLGGRLLNIDERVTIEQALVEEFAQKSQSLSPKATVAWARYARLANFSLDYLSPISSQTDSNTDKSTPDNNDQSLDQSSPPGQEDKAEDEDKLGQIRPEEIKQEEQNRLYRWLIALTGIIILYYIFVNNRRTG